MPEAQDEHGRQQLIESWRTEAMALFSTAQSYNARMDQLVAFAVTLMAAAAVLGLKDHREEVLLGVPAVMLLLMTYALQVHTDVRVMGIARRRLEQRLEEELGQPALIYRLYVEGYRRGTYIRGITGIGIVVLVIAVVATLEGASVAAHEVALVKWAYLVLLMVLWLCVIQALLDARRARTDAERHAPWPDHEPPSSDSL